LVARLLAERQAQDAELAVAASGGRSHPVVGLWPVDLAPALRRALTEEDIRKIDRWTARFRLAEVTWPTEPIDPFFNANRPDDLAAAEAMLAERQD
jgi:molybdopterin-guanine dinucleotide biosynthesis protein A